MSIDLIFGFALTICFCEQHTRNTATRNDDDAAVIISEWYASIIKLVAILINKEKINEIRYKNHTNCHVMKKNIYTKVL